MDIKIYDLNTETCQFCNLSLKQDITQQDKHNILSNNLKKFFSGKIITIKSTKNYLYHFFCLRTEISIINKLTSRNITIQNSPILTCNEEEINQLKQHMLAEEQKVNLDNIESEILLYQASRIIENRNNYNFYNISEVIDVEDLVISILDGVCSSIPKTDSKYSIALSLLAEAKITRARNYISKDIFYISKSNRAYIAGVEKQQSQYFIPTDNFINELEFILHNKEQIDYSKVEHKYMLVEANYMLESLYILKAIIPILENLFTKDISVIDTNLLKIANASYATAKKAEQIRNHHIAKLTIHLVLLYWNQVNLIEIKAESEINNNTINELLIKYKEKAISSLQQLQVLSENISKVSCKIDKIQSEHNLLPEEIALSEDLATKVNTFRIKVLEYSKCCCICSIILLINKINKDIKIKLSVDADQIKSLINLDYADFTLKKLKTYIF